MLDENVLSKVNIEKQPFKTFIGKAAKGFGFLGYRLVPKAKTGIGIAWMILRNHMDKPTRLCEQNAPRERIGEFIRGWLRWVRSGVQEMIDMGRVVGEYLTWVDLLVGPAVGYVVLGVVCDGGRVTSSYSQFKV